MTAAPPICELVDIRKDFVGVVALDGVSLACAAGEVHAVCGENGAGKSTLMKILGGVYRPDAGEIRLDGQPVRFAHPAEARARGISVIHQEFSLLPDRTVAQNLFLGLEPTRFGLIDRRRMQADSEALLRRLGVAGAIRPDQPVSGLSVARRQMVEIAKALALDARILVMDEPTASLDERDAQSLFAIIRALRDQGVAILYISHRMPEIFALADRITVLKDGRHVATAAREALTPDAVVRLMVGRAIQDYYPPRPDQARGLPVLTLRNAGNDQLGDISLAVHEGEIVGVAGLEGSGKGALARAIFGATPFSRGAMAVAGHDVRPRSPRAAIRLGIGFLSEDRKDEGIVALQSVKDNCLLATRALAPALAAPDGRASKASELGDLIRRVDVRAAGPDQPIRLLSGGNQQKAIVARWLARDPRLFLFCEPTRGIDVNAKASLYRLMRDLAGRGAGILAVSSDLPELIGISDRILVMRAGRIVGERPGGTAEAELMALATGHAAEGASWH